MKRTFKMMISVATVLMCMFALVSVSSAETEGNFTYAISSEGATITGYVEKPTGELVIPDTIGGYPVTVISGRAFENCTGLTSVTIPKGVKRVLENVFFGCTKLAKVEIPDSITEISSDAFYETELLSDESNWENGVCYIDNVLLDRDFETFRELLKEQNGHYIIKDGTKAIGNFVFCGLADLTGVTMPEGMKSIGPYAFSDCTGLTSVMIPESIESIGVGAFSDCTGLTSVTIPDGVKSIGKFAFSGCKGLTDITIPESVTDVGEDAFYYTGLYNDESNWEEGALYQDNVLLNFRNTFNGSYTVKDGTRLIADSAFYECGGLTSVTIPDSVKSIGNSAFSGCRSLTSVTIPEGVKNIGFYTFSDCITLNSIELPSSLETVCELAFYGCTSLVNVTYHGTEEAWKSIVIWDNNDALSDEKVIFNFKGIPVTGIALDKSAMTLKIGETLALVAVVTPDNATDKSMAWRSSNEAVATVNGGVITAKAPGKAEITAVTNDGAYSAKCIVTVKEAIDEDTPIIKAESAKGKAGQTVDVKIMVKNNPGAALMSFELNYDKNAMTLKNATLGEIFTGDLDCNLNRVPFVFTVYAGQGNKTNDGLLVTLTFEIAEDCAEGEYALEISAIDCLNLDEEAVNYVPVNGKITVNNVIPGDVTGDGVVTRSDLLRLAKYFSGFEVEIDSAAADVTGDGEVTRSDLLRLAKYFSGFDVKLGK